jgi:hypothetical protein
MKLLTLLLFTSLAVAQSPRTHLDSIPNAPSASQPNTLPVSFSTKEGTYYQVQELPPKPDSFWRGHPTRTKIIIAAIGGGIGLTIALATRHNCPKKINGYVYDGTPPCPGPDYDPGGLRWRF